MTENTTEKKKSLDFQKFQYGALAGQLMKSREGAAFVPGALDVLASELDLGEHAQGFIEGTYSSRQGLQKATEIYSGLFEQGISAYKPSEVIDWYNPVIGGLEEEAKKTLLDKFSSEKTFGEIQNEMEKSSYILNAPESMGFSDEEKVKAQETLRSYESFNQARGFLDMYMMKSLEPAAIEKSKTRTLTALVESWKQAA